jgi:hypothetical protein
MYSGIPFGGLLTSVVAMSLAGDAVQKRMSNSKLKLAA